MKYQKTKKHPVAFLLAALLVCQPITAQAVTFADINNVPWPGAEVSINKAAELGLVVGETINGKSYFKPKDPVSLTQSCQLAYKMLLETGKAKADAEITKKWSAVMSAYKIQSWAQPAVSYCLENGIVEIAELDGFVNGEVNVSATREQAATILGRALEVGVPDLRASTSTTIFKDNASISATARPYVALLNSKKIVNGDDVGKFNPKSTLNRTETAVMVTNLHNVLKTTPTVTPPAALAPVSGTVKDMNSLYVNLENSSSYYLFASSGITATLNGASSSAADIAALFKDGKTVQVNLTFDSNNRITKLEATVTGSSSSSSTAVKETSGTLTKVRYDDMDDDGSIDINKKSTYRVEGDRVSITINNKDYDLEGLYDLWQECEEDDQTITVELTLDKNGALKNIVGKIRNADGKSDGDVEGILADISYDEDDEDGKVKIGSTKYDFDKETRLEIDGKTAKWDDLVDLFEEAEEDDEELEIVLILDQKDKKYATDVEIYTENYKSTSGSSSSSDEDEGTIEKVTYDEDDDEGTIKVGGVTYDAYDTDDVEIDITDGNGEITTWEELYNAYQDKKVIEVELEVDDDEVLEITGYVSKAKGYLSDFDDEYLKLKGKSSSTTEKYYFTDYDRSDDEEEEDWKDAAESIKMTGVRNIQTLYDLYDLWLDDPETNLSKDKFDMTLTLNKKGYITKIEAELE